MAGYAGPYFERKLGRKGKTALQALAGSLIGLGEVALLPLDSLKVKRQTGVVQGNASIVTLLRSEPRPFRGGTWTAARNMVGCFALFGASAAVKDLICAPGMTPTWTQTFFASFCGAAGCIAFASPLDVIKVRVQATPIDSHVSGLQIAKDLVRKEGWSAFTKGLTPKLLATGPKLTFSFTVAQLLYSFIQGFEGIDSTLLEKGKS
ncbi:hypothetical protein HDU85_004862 [Gaertneriomyces sp. JEL0708]|nr:hypothetical protein HDU85_004862 [Gaertneriomyces sp. JEL0708]